MEYGPLKDSLFTFLSQQQNTLQKLDLLCSSKGNGEMTFPCMQHLEELTLNFMNEINFPGLSYVHQLPKLKRMILGVPAANFDFNQIFPSSSAPSSSLKELYFEFNYTNRDASQILLAAGRVFPAIQKF